jgi:hypothetical protein
VGDGAIWSKVHAGVPGAVDHEQPLATNSTAVLAETTAIPQMPTREVDKGVLHLDALNVGDAARGDVHVASGVHPVPGWRCA